MATGPGARERLGFRGAGPTAVITDLGVLEPDPESKELVITAAASRSDRPRTCARRPAGRCRCAPTPRSPSRPTAEELAALRALTSQ